MAKSQGKIRHAIGRVGQWMGGDGKHTTSPHQPAPVASSPPIQNTLSFEERLAQRFDTMMNEVEALSSSNETSEEKMQYAWIATVGMLLPIAFCIGLGYEDGLFMTGFHQLLLDPIIIMAYIFGYGLEALRVGMVFSMARSKAEQMQRAYRHQFLFWLCLSVGCGIAQLASALVIQALGADKATASDSSLTAGAKSILMTMPYLVYISIAVRVVLCAIADWACSGYLYKKKQTIEQKVALITTKATNFQTIIQANINAQSMRDNAHHYQEVIEGERVEIKQLRDQQSKLSDMVFEAGMRQFRRVVEIEGEAVPLLEGNTEDEE